MRWGESVPHQSCQFYENLMITWGEFVPHQSCKFYENQMTTWGEFVLHQYWTSAVPWKLTYLVLNSVRIVSKIRVFHRHESMIPNEDKLDNQSATEIDPYTNIHASASRWLDCTPEVIRTVPFSRGGVAPEGKWYSPYNFGCYSSNQRLVRRVYLFYIRHR